MKNDYLWDKKGSDTEVENLENTLTAFRSKNLVPPSLPAKISVAEQKIASPFFALFKLKFAFASLACALIFFALVFRQWGNVKTPLFNDLAKQETISQTVDSAIEKEVFVEPIVPVTKVKTGAEKYPRTQKNITKIRHLAAPIPRPTKKFPNRKVKEKPLSETLTAEEKFAYNQLMLALSITSEKLKIVKDKVDGIEQKTAVLESAK